jgi:arsenate reductase (thioredoxin)
MAQGWIEHLLGDRWEARSAGTLPAPHVHPLAVRAMAEVGVDISAATPEHVFRYLEESWGLVVTVCDFARETCPVFPRPVAELHLAFYDPVSATGNEEERLVVFRKVRDEIKDRLIPEIAARYEPPQR